MGDVRLSQKVMVAFPDGRYASTNLQTPATLLTISLLTPPAGYHPPPQGYLP